MKKMTTVCMIAALMSLTACHTLAPNLSTKASVQARFVPERSDDFAFENDKIAFRVYGPALKISQENNGADCWLKRVDYPIIDKWYQGHVQGKSYHVDTGEGYDPFHVGSSLGCGGIALVNTDINNNTENSDDILLQPNVYQSYKIIEKTADKVVFELTYFWRQSDIREIKRITLEKGNQLYKAESQFTQQGKPVKLTVAVGVTTHDGKANAYVNKQNNIVTTWEPIDDSALGTAILLPKNTQAKYVLQQSNIKDRSHALLITDTDDNGKLTYYAGFAWKKAGDITSLKQWQNYTKRYLTD